jgi:hypothetical protein
MPKALTVPKPSRYALARLWGLVLRAAGTEDDHDGTGPCWEWVLSPDKNGRVVYVVDGHWRQVTRVVYRACHGEDPGDLHVRHSCDDPICLNPAHMWLGTRAENGADMAAKGRGRKSRFTTDDRDEWHVLRTLGFSAAEIAAPYGCSAETVNRIPRGQTRVREGPLTVRRRLAAPAA